VCNCSRYSFSQAVRERDYVLRLYVIFRLGSLRVEREREILCLGTYISEHIWCIYIRYSYSHLFNQNQLETVSERERDYVFT